jgi:hypothetical protein
LCKRAAGIRGLPATDQIELAGQTVQYVALAAQKSDLLMWLPVSDGDVEITAQHKVGAAAKPHEAIKNVLHGADVTAFTDRSVNAEYD